MDEKELVSWFPQARLSQEAGENTLALGDGRYLNLADADLTERERYLLSLLSHPQEQKLSSPWQSYLQGQGTLPQSVEAIQFIHIHLWSQKEVQLDAWQAMMTDLLPSQLAQVQLTPQDYLIVLEQGTWMDYQTILADTLSALEFDFGLRLTLLVGQVWPYQLADRWPQLYQAEANLFAQWRVHYHQSTVLSFSQLFLWGQGRAGLELGLVKASMLELIDQQDMQAIILALWTEGAVVTKAAQVLYIHRNTLQYRLDKWQDMTGLQLKDLTDLSFCYQVLLDRQF
ncbi:helix-turn-helix domain-containing protein [Streptococcus suis]|uniref:helix-turn-helix domain-containing protein n=1 Tax=Streptococcus suis TaxID=1307 RepID=UPI00211BB535|nr:helix-turn-helix domain-containing protein [Streptococcus suis]MCQ9225820.1 helix-turn-helix domain-containing protein [Streptococcus suis]MCQ9228093.1 helix-turn-helix domain-containing protein [Streptococcus suis]MCQ9242151.1 helix-turn-helix domain-containing protein [Streptococcus suis]MCQ9274384.1 helix-turn-helix domain-containing protein [Streptococcus suis]MDE7534812.1 helix-turn-helix domain-containing protein [Streptococcus suis]